MSSDQSNQKTLVDDEWARQGLKMTILGPYFWTFYGILALHWKSLPETERSYEREKFMFGALADLLPCIFCRNSYTHMWTTGTNIAGKQLIPFEWFWNQDRLDDWWFMIHNAVNEKLDKPKLLPSQPRIWDIDDSKEREHEFEKCFWVCIWAICVNFPADMSIEEMEKCSETMQNITNRIKTYILWLEQLKNVLPTSYSLCQRWSMAYFENPPYRLTFCSRSNLVNWLYIMTKQCIPKESITIWKLIEPFHNLRADFKK